MAASLHSLGRFPPGGHGMPPAGSFTLAPTMRMIDRVHRDTPHSGPNAQVARASRLTDRNIEMIHVPHLSDHGAAVNMNHPNFRTGHAQNGLIPVLRHELYGGSRRPG